ncbi:hypothetical protein QTA58_09360 [Neorhizobium sp. CSC1952]|uniref:hypothetical protein n=1 Tax=Neorhizobium sp. CSC1952 TaxID=2978974 RepID=UPI0025A5A100|nr:hypothetical protein [Rhizobium sp. CSC1952]WJR68931.1 hypothetical protein QTA58_09360 [Rhizobium sp. CSC1952]
MTRSENLLNSFSEREDTHMRACELHIAASALPAIEAAQRACFSAFSKTTAKTTTKTV